MNTRLGNSTPTEAQLVPGTLVARRQTGIVGSVLGVLPSGRVTVSFEADLNPGRRGQWRIDHMRRSDLRRVIVETPTVKKSVGVLKLSPERAAEVRRLAAEGATKAALARAEGCGTRCIGRVLAGKTHSVSGQA